MWKSQKSEGGKGDSGFGSSIIEREEKKEYEIYFQDPDKYFQADSPGKPLGKTIKSAIFRLISH